MARLTLGYKIWDSVNFLACCSAGDSGTGDPADVITCGQDWNPRGASIVPYVNCDTGTVRWDLYDALTEYPADGTGARNGVAVTDPITGVITIWDVSGSAGSGEGETVAGKLFNFLSVCNCTDCEGGSEILAGEYECDYPEIPNNVYCYDVAYTTDGSPLNARTLAMSYNQYLVGYPIQTAYNTTNGATTIRICLNRPIASIGKAANQTWTLV